MTESDFEHYVRSRYKDQVDWYNRKANTDQRMHRATQAAVIILAAVAPAVAMADLRVLTSIITVTIAAVSGLARLYKFEENWVSYRTTCELLRKEKYYFDARTGDYAVVSDPRAAFVERVENWISRENTLWITAHRQENRSQGSEKA